MINGKISQRDLGPQLVFPQEFEKGNEVYNYSSDPEVGRCFSIQSEALLSIVDTQHNQDRRMQFEMSLSNYNNVQGTNIDITNIRDLLTQSSLCLTSIMGSGIISEKKKALFEQYNREILTLLDGTPMYDSYDDIGGLFFLLGF